MLDEYRDNSWMISEHWPLNEPHVRLMIADVMKQYPVEQDVNVLDVGCFNGYISLLFSELGYRVTGSDICELEDRKAIFERSKINYYQSNLNDLQPFSRIQSNTFEVVIIAQVIEHILNHPLGLVRSLASIMKPGGLMILTTPNPTTVMAGVRILRGRSLLWGTNEFIDEPKIDGQEVISKSDIHYREYTRDELHHMLRQAGLRVERSLYLSLGNSRSQSTLKRAVKNNPLARFLMSKRLFASNHYIIARKPIVEGKL